VAAQIEVASGLKTELEAALGRFRELVDAAKDIVDRPEAAARRAQLRALTKVSTDLERKGVPVPEDIRRLVTSLEAEMGQADEADKALAFAADSLDQILRTIGRRHMTNDDSTTAATSVATMRDLIVEVLREHDGVGKRKEVFGWIGAKMEGRFLPGDLKQSPSGSIYWHNVASHARHMMVREGVLREGSPVGVWELDE